MLQNHEIRKTMQFQLLKQPLQVVPGHWYFDKVLIGLRWICVRYSTHMILLQSRNNTDVRSTSTRFSNESDFCFCFFICMQFDDLTNFNSSFHNKLCVSWALKFICGSESSFSKVCHSSQQQLKAKSRGFVHNKSFKTLFLQFWQKIFAI